MAERIVSTSDFGIQTEVEERDFGIQTQVEGKDFGIETEVKEKAIKIRIKKPRFKVPWIDFGYLWKELKNRNTRFRLDN